MSVSVYSEIVYETYVRRRYEVILIDNIGNPHTYILGMYNHQPDNDGSEVEAQQIEVIKRQEIEQWIVSMENGLDPWHSTPYVNVTPLWNTWNDAASESLRHWLIMDDRQQLLNCQLSANSTSNNDLDDVLVLAGSIWGDTELRSEIQQAENTQTELDSYVPSVTEI